MKNFFLLFVLFLGSKLSACALCVAYTSSAHIRTDLVISDEKITNIRLKWEFSPEFSEVLLENYDENENKKFNKRELAIIKDVLLDYILPKVHLTQILVYEKGGAREIKANASKNELFLELNALLSFGCEFSTSLDTIGEFNIKVFDDEGFFNFFFLNTKPIALENDRFLLGNANLGTIFFKAYTKSEIEDLVPKDELLNEASNKFTNNLFRASRQSSQEGFARLYADLARLHQSFLELIKGFIVKPLSASSLSLLALISFIYGLFHASAPGHSNLLLGSYALSRDFSTFGAASLTLLVGFLHILFGFVLVIFFVLKSLAYKLSLELNFLLLCLCSLFIITLSLCLPAFKFFKPASSQFCVCAGQGAMTFKRLKFSQKDDKGFTNFKIFQNNDKELKNFKFFHKNGEGLKPSHKQSSRLSLILIASFGLVRACSLALLVLFARALVWLACFLSACILPQACTSS